MRLIPIAPGEAAHSARDRLSNERGFTIVWTLGVLLVTALLLSAVFLALQGEIRLGNDDAAAKRAYAAATAGINAYLYDINQNPNYWETCANDSTTSPITVPGSSDGASYSYAPIYANGNTTCTATTFVQSLVDNTTGTIRMVFTGTAGTSPVVTRSIVASFRMKSPLDFLWYTNYEALDSSISGYSACGVYYRNSRNSSCNISWVTGDVVNGPMYTNDQYLIGSGAKPVFGRDPADAIESSAPGSSPGDICSGNNCGKAVLDGTPVPNAPYVAIPSDSSELLSDAQTYGNVFPGTTTINLTGTTASVVTCTSSSTSSCKSNTVNLVANPIIYVNNASGCTPPAYTPFSVSYPSVTYPSNSTSYYGCAGDVYVSGNYTTPVTIVSANNIIIDGNITTSADANGNPTGTSTLGLVANEFIRVMHGVNGTNPGGSGTCNATNNASQTLINPTIDAAILALNHGFIVDNYNCGASPGTNGKAGVLTVHGAIVQDFRGAVGTGTATTGYLKNYGYDDRLANVLPPFLFDLSNTGWHISRETLCTPGSTTAGTGCQAPG
jgi:type II secretory pathway pseudopilin PulG